MGEVTRRGRWLPAAGCARAVSAPAAHPCACFTVRSRLPRYGRHRVAAHGAPLPRGRRQSMAGRSTPSRIGRSHADVVVWPRCGWSGPPCEYSSQHAWFAFPFGPSVSVVSSKFGGIGFPELCRDGTSNPHFGASVVLARAWRCFTTASCSSCCSQGWRGSLLGSSFRAQDGERCGVARANRQSHTSCARAARVVTCFNACPIGFSKHRVVHASRTRA